MVLHLIITTLAISLLSGVTFEYDLPNDENEVILLVDSSFSGSDVEDDKDEFISDVISSNNGTFKLGIVSFGFDQVYAVELTSNMSNVYEKYLTSAAPDNSATDIEAALTYTASLFTSPKNGRIVLLSDAIETDGGAMNVIKNVAAMGIKVDTVDFTDGKFEDEVQIVDMKRPDSKIRYEEEFTASLVLNSSYDGDATVSVYIDGVFHSTKDVELIRGEQSVKIPLTLETPNPDKLHRVSFDLTSRDDTLENNNSYHSYFLVENFNKLLLLETYEGESDTIKRLLGTEFEIETVQMDDTNRLPKDVNDMRAYDQVILCNVSYADMPEGFEKTLYDYVTEIGGGLFTVCGNKQGKDEANAFTETDIRDSQYLKKLLPVDIVRFTPPVAVMILIDKSGSMYSPDLNDTFEDSKLYDALLGAEQCLSMLSERDYIGVFELDDYGDEALELTAATKRGEILNAISNIGKDGGGTIFSSAISAAGRTLSNFNQVEKKHIIIITDGEPDPTDVDRTKAALLDNAEFGITTSIIGIDATDVASSLMKNLLVEYAGVQEKNFHNVKNGGKVSDAVREDMNAPEISDFNHREFQIQIGSSSTITKDILQENMPTLDGFYGMKEKDANGDGDDKTKNLQVIMRGEFTPIYTQWEYGKGHVGTFGSDLNGTWSDNFIGTPEGEEMLKRMIRALMPDRDIRLDDIDAEYIGDNYKTQLNVFTNLNADEYVEITVTSPSVDGMSSETVQTFTAGLDDTYSRFYFNLTTPGVHTILAQKKDDVGRVLAEKTIYKSLPYSMEYDMFYDDKAAEELISKLAASGHGFVLENPWQVYENSAEFNHKVIDPLIPFLITVCALFLLDIAVRKFKWKWIHELIRDKKATNSMAANKK